MPEIRKVGGAEVTVCDIGTFAPGQTYEVSREDAEYLTSERDFLYVKEAEPEPETVSEDAADDAEPDEEADESDEDPALEDLTHDELKERAEERGIADEIDLRSKESIIDALED